MEKNFKSHTHTEELETLNLQKNTCVLLLMIYVWLWRNKWTIDMTKGKEIDLITMTI